jgi:hypothetical protein
MQQPSAGNVIKTEYSQMWFSRCYFCRGSHITRNCMMHDEYTRDGKIKITDTNKISMPDEGWGSATGMKRQNWVWEKTLQ